MVISLCATCDIIRGLLMGAGMGASDASTIAYSQPVVNANERITKTVKRKIKRKVSKYQKRFGVELKKLKRKHPRTAVSSLMKKAHRITKKALK